MIHASHYGEMERGVLKRTRAAMAGRAWAARHRHRLRGGASQPWRRRRALCPHPPAPRRRRSGRLSHAGLVRMTPLGMKLRAMRAERGVSLKEMAAAIGVSSAYLSALEHGRRGRPTWLMIQRIIAFLQRHLGRGGGAAGARRPVASEGDDRHRRPRSGRDRPRQRARRHDRLAQPALARGLERARSPRRPSVTGSTAPTASNT